MTRALLIAALLLAVGCNLGLDSPDIVKTPRILAIVVEPPESAPGVDVAVSAMISIPADRARPLALHWRVCTDPESVLDETGFNIDLPGRPICDEATLPEDEPFRVDGTRTQTLVDTLRGLAMIPGFDASVLESVLATAGLAYVIELEVLDADGNALVAGYKRAAVTTRAMPTTNPPSPTFRLAETTIVTTEEPFTCAALDPSMLRIAPRAEVELAPLLPEGAEEEDWLETFPIFDYTGGLLEGHENAYYSWYATAGSFSSSTTQPPDRDTIWYAPETPGPQTLWLVVRDGHLGTSACRLEVEVAE